jgi:hypothetical protein
LLLHWRLLLVHCLLLFLLPLWHKLLVICLEILTVFPSYMV